MKKSKQELEKANDTIRELNHRASECRSDRNSFDFEEFKNDMALTLDQLTHQQEQIIEEIRNTNNNIEKLEAEITEINAQDNGIKTENIQLNKQLESSKQEITELKAENGELQVNLRSANAELQKKEEELKELHDTVDEVCGQRDIFRENYEKSEKELAEINKELTGTENKLRVAEEKLEKTANDLKSSNDVIERLNEIITGLKTEKSGLEADKQNLTDNLNTASATINSLETEKSGLETANLTLTNEHKILCEKLESIGKATKDYHEIYTLMLECESVQSAFEKMSIKNPQEKLSDKELITFITHFSPDYGFARIIYNALESYKNQNKDIILKDSKEYQLISRINEYYQKIHGNTQKALDDLNIIKKAGNNEEVPFKRASMKSLTEPRRTDFYTVKGVYVPALMRQDDGSVDKKAIVDAVS